MLKFPITTDADLKEAAQLEKRRQYENERKARIFNARQRIFGQDYEAIELQIADKTKERHIAAERERKEIEEQQRQANVVRAKDIEQERERRRLASEMNFYRCQFQRKEESRDFDLNDPNFIRNSQPMRLSDNDPRLGVSSAQMFIGEDLTGPERKKAQHEQQRAWLEQQIKERKQAEDDRKKADMIMQGSLHARDQKLVEIEKAERENKMKIKSSIMRYNQELANEQFINRQKAKKNENDDNLAEIYNMLGSDMLTENPDVANSKLVLNKKIAFMYRGMTPEEREQFRKDQHQQALDKQKAMMNEQMIEKQWDQHSININRDLTLKQIEMDRDAKKRAEALLRENAELAAEQTRRNEYINKVVYSNRATNDFFDKFNTTSR